MTKTENRASSPMSKSVTRSKPKRASWLSWAAIGIPAIAIAAVIALGGGDREGDVSPGVAAPAFDLTATDGSRRTLGNLLSDGDALLYFSMGPGCDGCFLQIPEIETPLADLGITLVPVMVDRAAMVEAEAARFGISTPILIDADRTVSEAYGMIGIYGHGDRPSHSFALVDQNAEVKWVGHYAEMFVPFERLLEDIRTTA